MLSLMTLIRVGLTILPLLLAPALRAEASGIAGPDQTMAEGLIVLLGDPTTSGTGRGSDTWRWRQIQPAAPLVKLSHINYPNTMFVAPPVSQSTTFQFELSKNSGQIIATVNIIIVPLGTNTSANTTFIDRTLAGRCTTYDPSTRLCGSGSYTAMNEVFSGTFPGWYPAFTPGRRYIFRGGTYPYILNAGSCRPVVTPIVYITDAVGTSSAPIQFKAYQDPNTGAYETVVLDGTVAYQNGCEMTPFFIRKSSYVIIEGFTVTKAVNAGQAFYLGGAGFGTGGINGLVDPVHHVTVRHSTANYNGGPNTWRGAFYIQGPSHEVLFDHVEAHHGGTGAEYGVPHSLTNTLLPYNIWTQYLYSHHNVNGGGNGGGILLMGARNSIVSHAVLSYCSDGGGGTQGPFADDNVFEHITTFGHDQTLSPSGVDGNERGIQMGNVNNNLALNPPYPSGGRDGVFHHIIAYDNMGNGVNDAQGSHNGQYLHMSVFNNTRHGATRSVPGVWSGLGFESEGGTGTYPGVTIPATLTNTLSFHNIVGGIPADGAIRSYTIQDTNLLSLDPAFSTGTPAPGAASTLTSDTALYTDAPRRTPNPNFGAVAGLVLRVGSPAIDRGTFVAGFHCDRADDAPVPYPANDPNCVHWRGAAPDIGAYEYGGSQVSSPPAGSPPAAPTGLQVR